jgi:pimeloyl-ACP methyl ester carboxylesterase
MIKDTYSSNEKPVVLFVPGGVMPGDLSYASLLRALGDQIHPIVKDLEIYATDAPPSGYGLETEVEGIHRSADAAGVKRFHLVGYSAGGASSLAFTAKYPERLNSLALIEPAWIGAPTLEDAEDWAELNRVMTLPPAEQMEAFKRWQVRPGVQPPSVPLPPGPPPAWLAKRPAGMQALSRAFNSYHLDQNRYRLLGRPVYYALGSLSTRFYERAAKTLARFFPDFQVEEYEGRSHFDPPHRAEPGRFAGALLAVWARSGTSAPVEEKMLNMHQ